MTTIQCVERGRTCRFGNCRCRWGLDHGVHRRERRSVKKLWVEEHLGIKLNWYQRIWFWPQDREMRRKHRKLLAKIEELNRRDEFLQKIEDEMHPHWDADGSYVATIPDIDIDALLKEADQCANS